MSIGYRSAWIGGLAALFLVAGIVVGVAFRSHPTPKAVPAASVRANEAVVVRTVELHVGGMHCDGCVQRITQFLEKTPGVVSASVSLEDENAVVALSTSEAVGPALVDAVVAAGYSAEVVGPGGDVDAGGARQ